MSVKIYTTPKCQWCKLTKEYLSRKGVKFEEYNIDADHEKSVEMVIKSGQRSVPVIDINGTIIVGFDKVAIDESLQNDL